MLHFRFFEVGRDFRFLQFVAAQELRLDGLALGAGLASLGRIVKLTSPVLFSPMKYWLDVVFPLLTFCDVGPHEEPRHAVVVLLRPRLERVIVAFGTLQLDAEKQPHGGGRQIVRVAIHNVIQLGAYPPRQ